MHQFDRRQRHVSRQQRGLEITIEFPVAASAQTPRPTMTIATAFAEMDAAAVGRI